MNNPNRMLMSLKSFIMIVLVTCCCLLQTGCQENYSQKHIAEPVIDSLEVKGGVESFLLAGFGSGAADSNMLWLRDSIKTLYQQNSYFPFFIRSMHDSLQIAELLKLFGDAGTHGILPQRYGLQTAESIFVACAARLRSPDRALSKSLGELDVRLSTAAVLYWFDMKNGLVNPYHLDSNNYSIPYTVQTLDILSFLRSPNKVTILQLAQPKAPMYLQLQKALLALNKNTDTTEWKKLPVIDGKIEPGKKSPLLAGITQTLIRLGYVDPLYKIPANNLYDTVLCKAVKRFQTENGLVADGVLGKNTIEQMNITPAEKKRLIMLNLERLRHTPLKDTAKMVLVNIPEFMVHLVRDAKITNSIKVCTGQKRERNYYEKLKTYQRTRRWVDKPKNFETPQVYSRIYVIVTNPTWSVPANIARNETIHDIHKDTLFFKKKGFKVFKGNKQIDPSTVDWKSYSASNLPFSFMQDPGAGNALGKIKFLFQNKFSIYLHDTPTRPPFGQFNRAVSHGCVRVEKPLQLAEFLTQDSLGFTLDDIKCEIGIKPDDETKLPRYKQLLGRKPKIREFNFSHLFPVFVVYLTARANEDGTVLYRNDVYDKDKQLYQALQKAMTGLLN